MQSAEPRRRRRRRAVATFLVVAVGIAVGAGAQERTLRLAAGNTDGNYHRLASRLAAAAGDDLDVEVVATEGSYDNADRLTEGRVDAAILQSDVAYLEFFRTGELLALAGLGREPIHVVARRELGLERLSDLLEGTSTWRIATGEVGSGTVAQARLLLRRLALPTGRREQLHLSQREAIDRLEARTLDVMFLTSAVPAPIIERVAGESAVTLLEVDEDILVSVRRTSPFFEVCEVPYTAYEGMEHHAETLCTRALLVARSGLDAAAVTGLLEALAGVLDGDVEHPLLEPDLLWRDPAELAIPAHQAAETFHARRLDEEGSWMRRLPGPTLPVLVVLAITAVVLILFILFFRHPRVSQRLHRSDLLALLSILVVVWLAGSALMYAFEGEKNSAFRSFGASAIAILHYLFSGLESKYPLTGPGNVISIVMLIVGVAIATVFTTTLVRIFVTRALDVRHLKRKRGPGLMPLRDHVVIFGWSKRTERVIAELRSKDLEVRPPVVVISRRLPELSLARESYDNVWAVDGPPTDPETLERADLARARAALLLDDERSGDEDTSPVALALALEQHAPETALIAEARRPEEADRLRHLGSASLVAAGRPHESEPGSARREIVETRLLTHRLMARFLVSPGTIRLHDELLSFGSGSQELYRVPVPQELDGLSYAEAARRLATADCVPVGYLARGRVHLNPRRRAPVGEGWGFRLEAGDGHHLLAIADRAREITGHGAPTDDAERPRRRRRSAMRRDETDRGTRPPTIHRIGICGWNEEAEEILHQLQDPVVTQHHEFSIKVIAERKRIEQEHSGSNDRFRNVSFVFGDPTCREALEDAGIRGLESLVLLADKEAEQADHRSLVIALAARDVHPGLRLVAEVVDPVNREHFERIGGEVVSVQNLTEKLLAQAVISPGITDAFTQLLTASEDSNEIYLLPVPPALVDTPFQELYEELLAGDEEVLLLGYETRPQAEAGPDPEPVQVINPRQASTTRRGAEDWRQHPLGADDRLIVMAYEEPAWAAVARAARAAGATTAEGS